MQLAQVDMDRNYLLFVDFSACERIALPHDYNPLSNDKIVDLAKLKAFADDKFHVAEMIIFLSEKTENIVGKGENASNQHFLL